MRCAKFLLLPSCTLFFFHRLQPASMQPGRAFFPVFDYYIGSIF